ncbi:eukaryotic translation initiation factor 4B-like isoform X2 [Acropora muricata]|uniref:eukaryotic translation initiation factor 4B-like isoform X2 n=1 Tax=Acropora muricata TaxID=159855 RepID=UPI0034E486B5
MAETGKKAKKKKSKAVPLTEFLAKDENGPSITHSPVFSARSTNWADESEGLSTEVDNSWPEEAYGGVSSEIKRRAAIDRAALPTAPRAARGPDVDLSKIPDEPPFTAFLGNLSYDVDREDILEFFRNSKITEVRLPQDGSGRLKGFGYAEFEDKAALIAALTLNNENLKSRRIRVDIAGHQQQERERGERDNRSNEPDRTESDWRRPESSSNQNGDNHRERYSDDGPRGGYDSGSRDRSGYRGYDDGPPRDRYGSQGYDEGPRDRWGQRDYSNGPPRERSGYRGFDDGPRDRSSFGSGYGRDRGFDDGPRRDDSYGDRGSRFGSGWDVDDRQSDRGGYGRERYDNRRYGDRYGGDRDRDRGGRDRFDDRRYGDRYSGDRDRGGGFGRDRFEDRRYGDRDRYDDRRDRSEDHRYGDRDRYDDRRDRLEDRRYGDRDRYDDRRGGDRYEDRSRDYDGKDWSSGRDDDRAYDARREDDREARGGVRERPKLQLQPRTKPVEESKDESTASSSVFGGAKPVDTASKEREIEEKLARQRLEDEATIKQEREKQRERREREEWPRSSGGGRQRRDSNRSNEGDRAPRERRDSSDHRSRHDSAKSGDEGISGKDDEQSTHSGPRVTKKEIKETAKETPKEAPPPPVNVWKRRMEQQKAAAVAESEPKSPKAEEQRVEFNVDSATMTVSPVSTSPEKKAFGKATSVPRKENSGAPRGRGRGGDRSNANGPSQERGVGRAAQKEKKERRPAEPRKYEETPQPVFHTASKFALLEDEDTDSKNADEVETVKEQT